MFACCAKKEKKPRRDSGAKTRKKRNIDSAKAFLRGESQPTDEPPEDPPPGTDTTSQISATPSNTGGRNHDAGPIQRDDSIQPQTEERETAKFQWDKINEEDGQMAGTLLPEHGLTLEIMGTEDEEEAWIHLLMLIPEIPMAHKAVQTLWRLVRQANMNGEHGKAALALRALNLTIPPHLSLAVDGLSEDPTVELLPTRRDLPQCPHAEDLGHSTPPSTPLSSPSSIVSQAPPVSPTPPQGPLSILRQDTTTPPH